MDTRMKETAEKEVQHEIIKALKRAADEGQPVKEIFEAVKKGQELEAWFEPSLGNQYQLVITVKER